MKIIKKLKGNTGLKKKLKEIIHSLLRSNAIIENIEESDKIVSKNVDHVECHYKLEYMNMKECFKKYMREQDT